MKRLTSYDCDRIDEVLSGNMKVEWARSRFAFYIRKGHCYADAVRYTLAWCRNVAEQKERDLSHDTGAEGWHRPWSDDDLAKLPTRTSQKGYKHKGLTDTLVSG